MVLFLGNDLNLGTEMKLVEKTPEKRPLDH